MAYTVTNPGVRLAGLIADLGHKLQGGSLSEDEFARFLKRQNPFAFPFSKNEHGHYIIEVTGLALTGAEEIARLEAAGFRVGDYAKSMLTSTNPDSYDALHRLEDDKMYKVALILGKEVKENRTTANLQAYGHSFGYGKPLAGIQPRIREVVSDKQLEEMGVNYIASLHETINDSGGHPIVLSSDRNGDGQWLLGFWDHPVNEWAGQRRVRLRRPRISPRPSESQDCPETLSPLDFCF
jgi:hypothetical protein